MVKKHHAWKVNEPDVYLYGEDVYGVPSTSKSSVHRVIVHCTRCDVGLGAHPLCGLAKVGAQALPNRTVARGCSGRTCSTR